MMFHAFRWSFYRIFDFSPQQKTGSVRRHSLHKTFFTAFVRHDLLRGLYNLDIPDIHLAGELIPGK